MDQVERDQRFGRLKGIGVILVLLSGAVGGMYGLFRFVDTVQYVIQTTLEGK